MDESDISMTPILNIGLFNSRREYICLTSRVVIGAKNGVNISELMREMVDPFPGLKEKIVGVISDLGRNQVSANQRFGRLIGKPDSLFQIPCTMHTTKEILIGKEQILGVL